MGGGKRFPFEFLVGSFGWEMVVSCLGTMFRWLPFGLAEESFGKAGSELGAAGGRVARLETGRAVVWTGRNQCENGQNRCRCFSMRIGSLVRRLAASLYLN